MGAERKVIPFTRAAGKGPQLVPPRETAPAKAPVEAVEAGDHSLAAALIIGGLAMIGALTFAGTVLSWLLLRNTGVNWMFQGVTG
jgi:hypothetical protein